MNTLRKHVESGFVPGLVAAVWRNGELTTEVLGTQSFGGPPMQLDSIFRLASITKPVVAAAALILVDDGTLELDAPVDSLLPELANRKVLTSIDAPLDDVVPARRAITVRHLLNMTFGLGTVFTYPPKLPIQLAMSKAEVAAAAKLFQHSPEEYMARIGALPLAGHPGDCWFYHTSLDVLGVLIARATQQPLSAFMQERLFGPLGMEDTGFFVPEGKRNRLVSFYRSDPFTRGPVQINEPWAEFTKPPAFEAGGAGLVSTLPDYLRFCRLLLNNGEYEGKRILSKVSVAKMQENQLTPEMLASNHVTFILGNTAGWGLGGSVELGNSPLGFPAGTFGWNGGYGTTAYIDPASGTAGVLLTQRLMDSPEPPPTFVDFWRQVFITPEREHSA